MDPRKKSYETGSIKYAPCLKYLSNTVKYMQIFHLNILIKKKKKSYMKSSPSNMLLWYEINIKHGPLGNLRKKSHETKYIK